MPYQGARVHPPDDPLHHALRQPTPHTDHRSRTGSPSGRNDPSQTCTAGRTRQASGRRRKNRPVFVAPRSAGCGRRAGGHGGQAPSRWHEALACVAHRMRVAHETTWVLTYRACSNAGWAGRAVAGVVGVHEQETSPPATRQTRRWRPHAPGAVPEPVISGGTAKNLGLNDWRVCTVRYGDGLAPFGHAAGKVLGAPPWWPAGPAKRNSRGLADGQANTAASPAVRRSGPWPTSISTSTSMPRVAAGLRHRPARRWMPSTHRSHAQAAARAASCQWPAARCSFSMAITSLVMVMSSTPPAARASASGHLCTHCRPAPGLLQQQGHRLFCGILASGPPAHWCLRAQSRPCAGCCGASVQVTTRAGGVPIRLRVGRRWFAQASGVVSSRTTIWSRCWVSPTDKVKTVRRPQQAVVDGGVRELPGARHLDVLARGQAVLQSNAAMRHHHHLLPPTCLCASAVAVRSMRSPAR